MKREKIEEELQKALKREVKILHDLVESLQKENQALLENRAECIKEIIEERDEILKVLIEAKKERSNILDKLELPKISKEKKGENLIEILEHLKDEGGTLKILKEQICDLAERIEVYGERNSYLLKNKVHLTKEMIKRLHPREVNSTYGPYGAHGKRTKKVSTLTIINQEG